MWDCTILPAQENILLFMIIIKLARFAIFPCSALGVGITGIIVSI